MDVWEGEIVNKQFTVVFKWNGKRNLSDCTEEQRKQDREENIAKGNILQKHFIVQCFNLTLSYGSHLLTVFESYNREEEVSKNFVISFSITELLYVHCYKHESTRRIQYFPGSFARICETLSIRTVR